MARNYILTEEVAQRKLLRMAYEILENNFGEEELLLTGIRESGSVIARNIQRLLTIIKEDIRTDLITIALDKKSPGEVTISKPVSFDNKTVDTFVTPLCALMLTTAMVDKSNNIMNFFMCYIFCFKKMMEEL